MTKAHAAALLSVALSAVPLAGRAEALPCSNLQALGHALVFPSEAIREGISEGDAVVDFEIQNDGSLAGPTVASSTNSIFGRAALDSVRRLQCSARPAPLRMSLPFRFLKSMSATTAQALRASPVGRHLNAVCDMPEGVALSTMYPAKAVDLKIKEGQVKVAFVISPDLRITRTRVVTSTNDVFSAPALELVSQVRCHGIGANAPLESDITINYAFKPE
jgi:TonB family protein